ncbi:MAG: F0F1 ATP synthase subunit B [Desulfobacterales bacterium]|nr:F0F1 ATP synthase subunit B [Desulfobacterales bacterium]
MKVPGNCRSRRGMMRGSMILLILALTGFLLLSGTAMAASSGHGTEAVAEGGHNADAGHAAPTKHWEATDTYRVMNFAVLFFGLFFLLRKPISEALNGRIRGIEDQLRDLEKQKADAEKALAGYNAQLAKLEKEAETIVAEYVRQGNEAKVRILEAAEASATKLEEQAKRTIEHEFKQARQQLQDEVMEKALEKAESLIQAKISDDDQNRLVDEYLEKVVA